MTLYEELGLTAQATAAEIKAAHRQAVKAHHPDVGGDARKFERAQRAYSTLSDPERRARYDSTGIEDDPSAATDEQLAHSMISTFILRFINGHEDLSNTDILSIIRNAFSQQKAAHIETCRQIERQLARVETIRDRLHLNGDKDKALPSLLMQKTRELNNAKSQEIGQIYVVECASKMLSSYTYRLDLTPGDEAKIWSALKS